MLMVEVDATVRSIDYSLLGRPSNTWPASTAHRAPRSWPNVQRGKLHFGSVGVSAAVAARLGIRPSCIIVVAVLGESGLGMPSWRRRKLARSTVSWRKTFPQISRAIISARCARLVIRPVLHTHGRRLSWRGCGLAGSCS